MYLMFSLRSLLAFLFLVSLTRPAAAQVPAAPDKPAFMGAVAKKNRYRAVYQLDSDDPKLIKQTLRNMKNALADPRLQGKLQLELVVFGGGVDVFRKSQPYEAELRALQQQGVLLAQGQNTMKERQISPDELFAFIAYVPTGNGELIIRQQQGWALVHP
ncbi:DsrE family protein [Hymenobacter sp. J193]|uniref:DsrE family protein n=2 Tax=Hymenobacter sp. J193 TaxID=2898429 RepID=UPI002150FBAA|nr:DsrE family protein [Hymenobacter sp. J193]MCR5890723.1 DsrE family protein [Hymenobacter sp. J193]